MRVRDLIEELEFMNLDAVIYIDNGNRLLPLSDKLKIDDLVLEKRVIFKLEDE